MKASIIVIIGTLISYINNATIYCNLNNYKMKFKPLYILMLITFSLINIFLILKLPILMKLVCNIVCLGLVFYGIRKDNFKTILFYVLLLWFFGSMMDIVVSSVILNIFKNITLNTPNGWMLLIGIIIQLLLNLFFRIGFIKKIVRKSKSKLDDIRNIVWMFLLMIVLTIIFGIFAFKNYTSLGAMSLFLFLLFISILLGIFFLKYLYDERAFKNTISNLLENNKYYLEVNTQNRVFKHNIIHKLNGIKSAADSKTKKLIDDLISESKLDDSKVKEADILPNGINGIICRRLFEKKRTLNYVINNYLKNNLLDVLTPRKYNKLCETLSVCLDNAVEASSKSKEKILHIVMAEDDKQINIKIINTFKDSIEIDKLGTANYTTKSRGHGLGLYSLFRRKDVILKTSIINSLFENNIIIKK